MSEFKPIFTSHAIERCAATWAFHPALPEKAFEQVRSEFADFFTASGFKGAQASFGFNIDRLTGKITPVTSGGPASFQSQDGKWIIFVSSDAIGIATERYTRWRAFEEGIREYVEPLIAKFDKIISVSGVKLEYWDRFNWTGDWNDFSFERLMKDPETANRLRPPPARREWHNHSGWFEYFDDFRRLYNVNVDVTEISYEAGGSAHPSVGIYTMAHDQISDETLGKIDGLKASKARLTDLHVLLKARLANMLNDGMIRRIGL